MSVPQAAAKYNSDPIFKEVWDKARQKESGNAGPPMFPEEVFSFGSCGFVLKTPVIVIDKASFETQYSRKGAPCSWEDFTARPGVTAVTIQNGGRKEEVVLQDDSKGPYRRGELYQTFGQSSQRYFLTPQNCIAEGQADVAASHATNHRVQRFEGIDPASVMSSGGYETQVNEFLASKSAEREVAARRVIEASGSATMGPPPPPSVHLSVHPPNTET